METQDPPNDTPGALKQVVLTPRDIPWSLRVIFFFGGCVGWMGWVMLGVLVGLILAGSRFLKQPGKSSWKFQEWNEWRWISY